MYVVTYNVGLNTEKHGYRALGIENRLHVMLSLYCMMLSLKQCISCRYVHCIRTHIVWCNRSCSLNQECLSIQFRKMNVVHKKPNVLFCCFKTEIMERCLLTVKTYFKRTFRRKLYSGKRKHKECR